MPIIHHAAKAARFTVLAAGLLTLPALNATAQQKDSGGRTMDLSDWQDIAPEDAFFDTLLHVPGPVDWMKKQSRDNRIRHEQIQFSDRRGRMFLQHVINAFFSNTVKTKLRDKDRFIQKLKAVPSEMQVSYTEPVEINHKKYPSGGYYSVITFAGSSRSCFIADGGYKTSQTIYDNDMGQYDTILNMNYCADNLPVDALINLVRDLRTVDDRDAYRKAVSQKVSRVYPSSNGGATQTASEGPPKRKIRKYEFMEKYNVIQLTDASFTVPVLSSAPVTKIVRRVSKGHVLSEKMYLGAGSSIDKVIVHHRLNGAFTMKTLEYAEEPDAFQARLENFVGKRLLRAESITAISPQEGKSKGHYAKVFRSHALYPKCIYAFVGYRLMPLPEKWAKLYDTTVQFYSCGEDYPDPANMQKVLAGIDYITDDDQGEYRTALNNL